MNIKYFLTDMFTTSGIKAMVSTYNKKVPNTTVFLVHFGIWMEMKNMFKRLARRGLFL